MYPLAPSGMEYTHTNMQGSFSDNPIEQSVRRHMRVQGIANPMDAGHEFETTTGHLTSASELRKRMRSQILSSGCGDSSTAGVMMGAKAKNLRTLPGGNFPHQPVSAPEFQFLRPKQYISGTTNLPDQEKCEDFWKEYTKFRIICTYLLYPGKISFSDVNKNFVKTLSDESFRERWDSFLDAETQAKSEMDEWSENIEKEYTNQYLLTALSVYASTSFQNFCNVNSEVFQKNSAQVYSDLQSKARGDLADVKANSLERCPDFVPATVKTMYTEYPVLMGGLILSSKMAMHLLRWTPIFSMEDENFYNLLQLLQDRSDPDFISTVLSLYQCTSGLAEGKSATHAAKLLNIIRYNEKLSKDFPNKASLGSMCKSALMSMRSQAEHLWADSKEKDRFFTMNLSEFIDAIWVLRTPYMSKKPMEEIIRKATAELMADMEEPSDEMVGYVLESMQLTLGGQELIDDVILLFKPNVFQLAGYRDVLTLDQTHYEAYRSAQQRDYYYACLVQGAAVRIGIDKVWASPDTPAPGILDEKNFINVVWKVIQECQPEWNTQDLLLELEGRAWRTREQGALDMVSRMRDLRDSMVNIWSESRKHRVTDVVHMIEVQTLNRLKRDGLIQWFDEPGNTVLSVLEICNWFRRDDCIRNQFALVVGRRMVSESLVSTNNANIMSHQRTASWAEHEYMFLHKKVSEMSSIIEDKCVTRDPKKKLQVEYLDYLQLQLRNLPQDRTEEAVESVMMRNKSSRRS